MLFRLLQTSIACTILIGSSLFTALYVEYHAKRIILANLHTSMKNAQVQSKFKQLSERVIKRVLYDPYNRRQVVQITLSLLKNKEIERNTKLLFERTFHQSYIDKVSYKVGKRFSQILLARWLNSHDYEKDW